MKYIMMCALLSGGVCVAGDYVAQAAPQGRAVGQQIVMGFWALDVAAGNIDGADVQKPKHSAKPLARKDPKDFNRSKKQKNFSTHHRNGYSGKK